MCDPAPVLGLRERFGSLIHFAAEDGHDERRSRQRTMTTIGTTAAVALAAEHEAAGRYEDAVNELARAAEIGDVDATKVDVPACGRSV